MRRTPLSTVHCCQHDTYRHSSTSAWSYQLLSYMFGPYICLTALMHIFDAYTNHACAIIWFWHNTQTKQGERWIGWFCHTLWLDMQLFSFWRENWMWGLASLLRECLERGKGKLEGSVNVTVNWVESVSFTRTNKPSQWSCKNSHIAVFNWLQSIACAVHWIM